MATTKSSGGGHLRFIDQIAQEDAAGLKKAHESYGPSWKKRGGIGAYMVMIRKFDRMEICVEKYGWDIFKAVEDDPRVEGILDDIRDARRYLMLIESVLREQGIVKAGNHRDNVESDLDNPKAGGAPDMKMNVVMLKAAALNEELGIKHNPDAVCQCFRCLAMEKLSASPHLKGCECKSCRKAKQGETHGIVQDQLKAEDIKRALRTYRQTTVLNELDHPAGCDCEKCTGPPYLNYRSLGAPKLGGCDPHPVACTCRACTIGRADRARARGCEPNCGCNDCLADHYLEQKHE